MLQYLLHADDLEQLSMIIRWGWSLQAQINSRKDGFTVSPFGNELPNAQLVAEDIVGYTLPVMGCIGEWLTNFGWTKLVGSDPSPLAVPPPLIQEQHFEAAAHASPAVPVAAPSPVVAPPSPESETDPLPVGEVRLPQRPPPFCGIAAGGGRSRPTCCHGYAGRNSSAGGH